MAEFPRPILVVSSPVRSDIETTFAGCLKPVPSIFIPNHAEDQTEKSSEPPTH
jgi:hypothetical protein